MRRAAFAIIGIVVVLPACCFFGYKILYPTYTYRYRLCVRVETPDGLRSGSSVIEVRYETFPEILTERNHASRIFGEAVFIDLGQGKNLIGLLASGPSGRDVDYPGRIVFQAFKLNSNDPNTVKGLPSLKVKSDLDIQNDVANRLLPTFVTFGDLSNFTSVKIAPPGLFNEIFGAGYELRSVSIEMTDEPRTEKIRTKLPWLPHPAYFNGQIGCGPGDATFCLHGGQFMRSN